MACSMGTSVGYDRARNKVSGGPMAHPLAHCQLESRFQSDTFVSTLMNRTTMTSAISRKCPETWPVS